MNEIMKIGNQEITVKEYKGQRVITFKDIDLCHERPDGTAKRNFNTNKKYFVENEDFFFVKPHDVQAYEIRTSEINNAGTYLITRKGYSMITKPMNDALAWAVQRELVNNYFNKPDTPDISSLSPQTQAMLSQTQAVINLELRQNQQAEELEKVKADQQAIRDVIALNPNDWREDTRKMIVRIAQEHGGNEYIKDVNAEIYKLIDDRFHVNLGIRLTNLRRRMAEAGCCKSKMDKANKVDVIAEDRALIEGYLIIIKEMAVKYGVSTKGIA